MFPGDSLSLILFLFLLQHQLDEELLQLLIAVVDAELFEAAGDEEHRICEYGNALINRRDPLHDNHHAFGQNCCFDALVGSRSNLLFWKISNP